MAAEITPEIEQLLADTYIVWFTSVRADGMPQPTPVWFVWEDGEFLIYTNPASAKIRNITANPKVALHPDTIGQGDSYRVFMGEAVIDPNAPKPSKHPAYFAKYEQGIRDIDMTPESYDEMLPQAVRVKPTHIRGE